MRQLLLAVVAVVGFSFSTLADWCQSPTSTASGTDNTNVTATVTDFTCVGPFAIASATLDATIGTQCTQWYWYDIVVDGVTVATQQCTQTGFDLTPYLPFTTVSIVSFDNPSDGIGDFVTLEATVNLEYFPPCSAPGNLNATNVIDVSADFDWTGPVNAVSYVVEWGAPGFTPGTGTEIGSATPAVPNAQATGLTPITTYEYYVMTDCGPVDGTSVWSGPYTFTTSCAIVAAPWLDDVEAHTPTTALGWSSQCWDELSTGTFAWDIDGAGGTPSTGTGPAGANSGTNYFFTEASSGSTGNVAVMTSPIVDLSGITTTPVVEYWYHMYGATIDQLIVEAWDGAQWNVIDNIVGQQQTANADPWTQRTLYLVGYTGNTQLRFSVIRGTSFTGDVAIDDIQIYPAPSCPAPVDMSLQDADLTSASFDWLSAPIGTETEWQLEYGAVGFTPGTGTGMLTMQNPDTLTGLASNQFYEVYVQAVCAPGDTSTWYGPVVFNTYNQGIYMDWDTECPGAGFIDISGIGTNLNLTDDSETAIDPLPFPILFQGQLMTNMTVGNNGGLQLGSITANIGYGGNFGTLADGTMFPWGDDLDDETGDVWAGVIGTPGNQTLIIQWDNSNNWSNGAGTVTFQIQIDEATGEIYYVYDDVEFGGTEVADDFGANADIGISGPNQDYTVSTNDPNYLMNESCVHFYYTDCPNPVNYQVVYTTFDEAAITWSAGLAGETDWTVIYGPEGFDPLTGGTTVTTTSPTLILPGLDDITTYDVYIYADCNPGVLQSDGFVGQFTTLPNCADPSGLMASTAVDSLFSSWTWASNPGYDSTGFNLQYGMFGFDLYDGSHTIVNADANFTDTTEDVTLLGGGVYELYVQGVCGADTSNWIGPVTFTMPLSNDSTCNAIDLMVDGTNYTFDNTGATTQTGEAGIAPPTTGFNETDGWGDSNMDFTTWFTFTAPSSGNMWIDCKTEGFDGQIAIYEATDCANLNTFTFIGGNDDAMDLTSPSPYFSICGLTPGAQYYLVHDSWSTVTTGVYSIMMTPIDLEAGSSTGILDVCTGDTVDLYNGLSGYDMGGTWTEEIATANFADPLFPTAGLAFQVFNFEYRVTEGCAFDSIVQQVQIYGPSSAGTDGTMTVCMNEPHDLLSGLGGNVDLGGTWYDPTNTALPNSAIVASNIPGFYNYDYITSNGVCPEDTANVVVEVLATCDYLNLQEVYFGTMDLYPNPTTGMIYIANQGSTEVFNYEITDVNGKVIATKEAAINGTETTEISLTDLEPGVYMINVHNENAEKTFRIIKQ